MRKKMQWEWEKLDETTQRAKVIGGWLVLHSQVEGKKKEMIQTESMQFVMDRDHEWTIVQPIVEVNKAKADDFTAK